MANIILDEKREEVEDGEPIKEACREMGVPFGCENGICGTCKITVDEGAENLNELNDKEEAMDDRDETHRLACQAKIVSGTVTIKLESSNNEDKLDEIDEDYLGGEQNGDE